jgi:hypothetical protein
MAPQHPHTQQPANAQPVSISTLSRRNMPDSEHIASQRWHVDRAGELAKDQTRFLLVSWLLEHVSSIGHLTAASRFNRFIRPRACADGTFASPWDRLLELSPSHSGRYATHPSRMPLFTDTIP